VSVPYADRQLQFLVLLPDEPNGLAGLEAKLTPALLASCARLNGAQVILHLPKFKLEPALMQLGEALRSLGMTSAFDQPRGSANFDGMAPRWPDDYLYFSEVFHKTFLSLDEEGTEAAAATAVVEAEAASMLVEPYEEVRVDHPFVFAIQHRASGACLFLGRVRQARAASGLTPAVACALWGAARPHCGLHDSNCGAVRSSCAPSTAWTPAPMKTTQPPAASPLLAAHRVGHLLSFN